MQMPANIDSSLLAFCGVNCLACSAYLSKTTPCPGCHADDKRHKRKSCANCAMKKCARNQGFSWCFECADFPCDKVKNISRRYKKNYGVDLIDNGRAAAVDMAAFMSSQRRRFTCPDCGGIIDQHNRRCSQCQKPASR